MSFLKRFSLSNIRWTPFIVQCTLLVWFCYSFYSCAVDNTALYWKIYFEVGNTFAVVTITWNMFSRKRNKFYFVFIPAQLLYMVVSYYHDLTAPASVYPPTEKMIYLVVDKLIVAYLFASAVYAVIYAFLSFKVREAGLENRPVLAEIYQRDIFKQNFLYVFKN